MNRVEGLDALQLHDDKAADDKIESHITDAVPLVVDGKVDLRCVCNPSQHELSHQRVRIDAFEKPANHRPRKIVRLLGRLIPNWPMHPVDTTGSSVAKIKNKKASLVPPWLLGAGKVRRGS
jgi:hypothetical protein